MDLPNSEITGVTVEVPEGHRHIRTTIAFADGTSVTLQEATVSNILRAFVTVKTHPTRKSVRLVLRECPEGLKQGFARWQLVEAEGD